LSLDAEEAQLSPDSRPAGGALAVTALTLAASDARVHIPDALGIRRLADIRAAGTRVGRREPPAIRHHPGSGPAGVPHLGDQHRDGTVGDGELPAAAIGGDPGPGPNRKDQGLILLPLTFLLTVIGHLVIARSRRYAE